MVTCMADRIFNVSLVARLGGKAGMRVMESDSCMPVNLNIIGSLEIGTSSSGDAVEIYMSGLFRTMTTTLGFLNNSMTLINKGSNMTKMISMIAWNVSHNVEMSMIRITGRI